MHRARAIPAIALLALTAAGHEVAAAEAAPPIWTLVPTRIDRQNEGRERIDPVKKPENRMPLLPDRPIRPRPDGSFSAGGQQVRIFGIDLPPKDRICEVPGGGRWPCGARANAYFIARLAAGTLSCRPRSAAGADVALADCAVAGKDLARLMLAEGWATADALADPELRTAEADARLNRRGIWQQTLPDF